MNFKESITSLDMFCKLLWNPVEDHTEIPRKTLFLTFKKSKPKHGAICLWSQHLEDWVKRVSMSSRPVWLCREYQTSMDYITGPCHTKNVNKRIMLVMDLSYVVFVMLSYQIFSLVLFSLGFWTWGMLDFVKGFDCIYWEY